MKPENRVVPPCSDIELMVPRSCHGRRVDHTLATLLRGFSVWRMQRLLSRGLVCMDAAVVDPLYRTRFGDCLRVTLTERPDIAPPSTDEPVELLYRDAWLAVVNKPAGLVVHPTGPHQDDTLLTRMQRQLSSAMRRRDLLVAGIVHRLDRETSGAIAVAFDADAHAGIQQQFERGEVAKSYLALLIGRVASDRGTIDAPIGQAAGDRHVLMSTASDARNARPARTDYRVLIRFAGVTLVRAVPKTGRNHQLRVHFASIGHPLIGEPFYAAGHELLTPSRDAPLSRHALHAERLQFRHPITGAVVDTLAPIPDDFRELIAAAAG